MKFNPEQTMKNLDGVNLTRPLESGDTEPMTMRFAIRSALIAVPGQPLTPDESLRRFDLMEKFTSTKEVDLKADEIVLIKNCLAQIYGPLVVGQVVRAIDG